MGEGASSDLRAVFVVHGRNREAKDGMFSFLRALGLKPLEWSQAVNLTRKASPYIGEVLEKAFSSAQAVVVLLTPDEITYLRPEYAEADDPETKPVAQARPNVLFEAGMAFGRHPDRTILVEMGTVRAFSDIAGRHAIRVKDDAASRKELAQRLKVAGCDVDTSGDDWLTSGDLTPPPPPGGGLPLGKRVPKAPDGGIRMTARYVDRGSSSGLLQLTNHCSFPIHNLSIETPKEAGDGFIVHQDGPISRLPAGETASFYVMSFGDGRDHFEITVRGETSDGTPIETTAFLSVPG